ncbi:hypothetical protein ACI3ET_13450 [Ornithinimicrobium sp. LYQ121]|uniref:hypothetical protein n=1 Tax=Ornithinimicrobium sp. LYQ121 TaxID=3378801 RepID=UPI0038528B14
MSTVAAAPLGADDITVDRAWPGRGGDGTVRTVEGRDALGRLRAGTTGADGRVTLLPYGVDPRLPALQGLAARPDADLVVHRAGRRAVLRCGESYVKVVRPGRAAGAARAAGVGARVAGAEGLAAPRVSEVTEDTVTLSSLPGRPAHELSDDGSWDDLWDGWATAWTRLQEQPTDPLPALPRHTWEDEATVLRDWAGRAAAAGLLPTTWTGTARDVAQQVSARRQGRLVVTHRDLHDKQLLWDGRRLGVLDLDTLCLADPVLDPANLAVHADLRRAQGLWGEQPAATVAAVAHRVAAAGGADDDALRTAELATVARLVCVYAFRPRWREVVLEWAGRRMRDLS